MSVWWYFNDVRRIPNSSDTRNVLMSTTDCSFNRNLRMLLRWQSPIMQSERHHAAVADLWHFCSARMATKNDSIKCFVFAALRLLICIRRDTSARLFVECCVMRVFIINYLQKLRLFAPSFRCICVARTWKSVEDFQMICIYIEYLSWLA